MYSKILVGFQGTEQGRDALALGQVLARATGAEMKVAAGLDSGLELAALARSEEADLVVLGSSHRGTLGRIVPGSTAAHLLADAPCAIAVAPPRFGQPGDGDFGWRPLGGGAEDAGMRVIGVGFDGSEAAHEALSTATALALRNGAALRVYTVAQRYAHLPTDPSHAPTGPSLASALQDRLHDAVRELPAEARALPIFLRGFPADELLRACKDGIDLLVIGSRRGGPLRRALHPSASDIVLRDAPCPVLISPAGVTAAKLVPA